MERSVARVFETLLVVVVVLSVGFGVNWATGAPQQPAPQAAALPMQQTTQSPAEVLLNTGEPTGTPAPGQDAAVVLATATNMSPAQTAAPEMTGTPATPLPNVEAIATPLPVDLSVSADMIDVNDAPLLQQAPGTMNILLLGSDASANQQLARTDSIMVVSINPNVPSVSMLSFPRDLQVSFPDGRQDRINTVYEYGFINKHEGGGPAYLALVLRKNFGIKIDHFARIDFGGFTKVIDTLGGVNVLVECELHETFPDKESPNGRLDLDFYPGLMTMNGKEALGYSRARYSTTDFDRARRQQKVLRAIYRKAREGNMLQNAVAMYAQFRESMETNMGPAEILPLVDIARRLENDAIKSRVITWPIVRSFTRGDGASVLISTDQTIPYIAEALAPPAGNQTQNRPKVEVINGSSREEMELVAAERLGWEGFQVTKVDVLEGDRFPNTQIINYSTTRKGSPLARLQDVFRVNGDNVLSQPDPSSEAVARVVLGEDYNSCPNTATAAGDVVLQPAGDQVNVTPAP
jgi:LCP family protein required for cell wall assembly